MLFSKKIINKYVLIVSFCLILFSIIILFADKKVYYVDLANDGAWCWFQDPRVVSYNNIFNKTYFGWVSKTGDIMIGSYDNNKNSLTSSLLHPKLEVDDHSAPSILVRNDGHIMAFYSSHNGKFIYYKESIYPEDISQWGDEKILDKNITGIWNFTYPSPVQLSGENNTIYLFWRGGNGESVFSTSDDNGITWADARVLFNVFGERPYTKIFSNGKDKIYFSFTDGHPNEVENNNIFFTYYQNGAFYKANGTFIKSLSNLPLNPNDLDLVYNSSSTKIKAWNWDIAVDKENNPVIVYATFPTINNHQYRYAYWNGKKWSDYQITMAGDSIDSLREPYYSGGITFNHNDPSIVYLSREIDGVYEIERWSTLNHGVNWSAKSLTSKSVTDNIRPSSPNNYDSKGPEVVWMYGSYTSYTKYDTVLKSYFSK